jgi:hypothetical protein
MPMKLLNIGGPLYITMPSLILELISTGERDSGVLYYKLYPRVY